MVTRLGVDIGGTFTDAMLIDDQGEIFVKKSPSTPRDYTLGVLGAIGKLDFNISNLQFFTHGTTVALNALIQRKFARTGLVTTRGFRDILEIMRTNRPDLLMYDLQQDKPEPFVPRNLRYEATERINYKGEVLTPLDEQQILSAVESLKRDSVTAIAVCLLHCYANSEHELKIRKIIREKLPETYVSLSSEVAPEWREFERTSTTVINACTMSIMATYLSLLEKKLSDEGFRGEAHIMQSNGGMMTVATAKDKPVNTIFCGPAAGAIGAAFLASELNRPDVITYDMGGTTCIVSLIHQGKTRIRMEGELDRWPIMTSMMDIHLEGAGGGSIAWLDKGGGLRVGPFSAAAEPGPVCYGQGGTEPTVTDANLVLGRINPDYFIGGEIKLDSEGARKAIKTKIADHFGMSLEEAASGILEILVANQARAVSHVSVQRGYDTRDFTLLAFGGGGGLHAGLVAQELEIPQVLVAFAPGHMSCLGQLVADMRYDYVRTHVNAAQNIETSKVNEIYAKLEAEGMERLTKDGLSKERIFLTRSADLRYLGQEYWIETPVPNVELTMNEIEKIVNKFNDLHEIQYGYSAREEPAEFLNLRVSTFGTIDKPKIRKHGKIDSSESRNLGNALKAKREVFFKEVGFTHCPIYEWGRLRPGNFIDGPALIEEPGSTIAIFPRQTGELDEYMNVIIRRE
ncbi:MAG: hydantoinase/oxoprolinase family protein [Candidatus Bathyarchaeia archaeon]